MDPLQHDPRTKQQIKDTLYAYLYDPVQQKFKARLDAIILKNASIQGLSHKSFTYKGTFYTCDPQPAPRRLNRLSPQLYAVMDEYLKDLKELNDTEVPFVIGFITQVLNASNDLHDYLKLLPESVHGPIKDLIASCPCRTRKLSESEVAEMQAYNQRPINLMKQRMMANLLL